MTHHTNQNLAAFLSLSLNQSFLQVVLSKVGTRVFLLFTSIDYRVRSSGGQNL